MRRPALTQRRLHAIMNACTLALAGGCDDHTRDEWAALEEGADAIAARLGGEQPAAICPTCGSARHVECCSRCGARVAARRRASGYCTERCARAQRAEDEASARAEDDAPAR